MSGRAFVGSAARIFLCWLATGAAWKQMPGHISGKDPTLAEVVTTLEEAKALCEVVEACHALSMERAPSSPEEKVKVYLKGDTHVTPSKWVTYVHSERLSGVSIPAKKATEGQLRQLWGQLGFPIWQMGPHADFEPEPRGGFLAPKPQMLSEPEPGEGELYTGAVLNLVGSNLLNITRDSNKDVLVNYFAPWCGHCQKFKPQYARLADNLKHVKTLVIAQMDASRNKVPGIPINRFPSIRFYPAHKKGEGLNWEGPRVPADMTEWLQLHASFNFSAEAPTAEDEETVFLLQGAGGGLLGDDEDL